MITGVYKKSIFSSDNGYIVGLLKVTDNDIDVGLNNQIITFTGYFADLNIEDNLILQGNFVHHFKYGDQFNVTNYEIIIPKTENTIISFFSSELFPGIGESKAKNIYDVLGDDAINIINENKDVLDKVKGLSQKNKDTIYQTLVSYNDSLDTIIKLNNIGFSPKDSNFLYHKYKNRILSIIDDNLYYLYNDVTMFSYRKIDALALKNNYEASDIRRIKASIIYVINSVNESIGNTYVDNDELYQYLNRLLGFNVDGDLFSECIKELITEELIIIDHEHFFIKKMYDAENNIASRISYLVNHSDNKYDSLDKMLNELQNKKGIIYDESQIKAIKSSLTKNISIITGGPGTGKTTIINAIISLYKMLNKLSLSDLYEKVILLAPTGRASKHLKEIIDEKIGCQTIHSFLKWNKENNTFGINEKHKTDYQLVIIDESSMIDTYLFDSLLKGLRFNTQIIIVGDYNQLPSVSSGQILKDLIESDCINTIKLEKLYRQSDNSNITMFARDINCGEYNRTCFQDGEDLQLLKSDSQELQRHFLKLLKKYRDFNYNDFIIMAPMYRGMNGIDNLNILARDILNDNKDEQKSILFGDTRYYLNDKIILLVNMPDLEVYNGDIGIITGFDYIEKKVTVLFDDREVTFNKSNASNFKLGYVISIHKSQGSEFNSVILVLLKEYGRMLYRKILYTGVTRAKKELIILGEEDAIKNAIANDMSLNRKTLLKERILDRMIVK